MKDRETKTQWGGFLEERTPSVGSAEQKFWGQLEQGPKDMKFVFDYNIRIGKEEAKLDTSEAWEPELGLEEVLGSPEESTGISPGGLVFSL